LKNRNIKNFLQTVASETTSNRNTQASNAPLESQGQRTSLFSSTAANQRGLFEW